MGEYGWVGRMVSGAVVGRWVGGMMPDVHICAVWVCLCGMVRMCGATYACWAGLEGYGVEGVDGIA